MPIRVPSTKCLHDVRLPNGPNAYVSDFGASHIYTRLIYELDIHKLSPAKCALFRTDDDFWRVCECVYVCVYARAPTIDNGGGGGESLLLHKLVFALPPVFTWTNTK
jgi:hypothetical protein